MTKIEAVARFALIARAYVRQWWQVRSHEF